MSSLWIERHLDPQAADWRHRGRPFVEMLCHIGSLRGHVVLSCYLSLMTVGKGLLFCFKAESF